MSFFKKILGKKTSSAASDATDTPPPAASQPANASAKDEAAAGESPAAQQPATPSPEADLMPMIDAEGKQVMVPRAEWRERVLLPHLDQIRDKPDELAPMIIQSLQNGFLPDMVEPAEQLAQIDPNAERGAVVLSIVYRELQRFEAAEGVLKSFIQQHGENANIVFNIGLVQGARNDVESAEKSFWRALELEPNHREACGALLALRNQVGGDAAAQEALSRIGALPGNWRARMWQARAALDRKEVEEALTLYRAAIELAGTPVPLDLLMQMTGDLGHTGHPDVMLKEAASLYQVNEHGIQGAHNLFRACLETGQLPAARGLLDLLFGQLRFDWRPQLSQWEGDFAQARMAHTAKTARPGTGQITLLIDDGPIWLPPQSPAAELFTEPVGNVPSVAFMGSTAESVAPEANENGLQFSDAAGRFSRAVPLFLAEQVRFGMQARVRPLVPWVAGDTPAFVVGRQPWTAAEAAQHARAVKPECTYTIASHVHAKSEPWRVEVQLVRAADATVLGSASTELNLNEPETGLRALAADVIALLQREAKIEQATAPVEYVVPTGRDFGLYLLCLEQLHSVRCHSMPSVPPGTLLGERDLLDAALHLCITQPENVGARLIFEELLRLLRPGRPQVVAEYGARVALLQKDKPLPGSAQAVLQRMFDALYTAPKKE